MSIALRTPRLLLREWRDDDLAPFTAMSSDPQVMAYLPPLDAKLAAQWVGMARRHWHENGFGQWVVELPGEAPFIGVVGLNRVRWMLPFTPAVELAWRLARPCWGKGYATEAARVAMEDGFGRLGLGELVAYTVPDNEASWRVMERLGMARDPAEEFDHPSRPEGHPHRRHILYRRKP